MSTITISFDFLVCETASNSFLCKFYYWDSTNLRIRPWTAIQSSKQDALALMQQYSNDLYTALLNVDGITPLGGGSITDYGSYSEMSNSITIDLSSQSGDIDYTQILTSINSNLASIAANSGSIANKNNQSDIVNCLNNIFCYSTSDNLIISAIKDSNNDGYSSVYLKKANLTNMFRQLARMFSTVNLDYDSNISLSNQILDNISKKICYLTPSQNNDNNSIFRILRIIALSLSKDSSVNLSNDSSVVSNASLKDISDKLANSNDLHTISQAIDLISTAIAQTPTTDISPLTSAVQNLKLEQNNLIQVEGDIDYRIKYDKNKEE